MKMSTKARYGLYACAKLAQDYDKGFISTTELANAIYVSDGYLEQIVSLCPISYNFNCIRYYYTCYA